MRSDEPAQLRGGLIEEHAWRKERSLLWAQAVASEARPQAGASAAEATFWAAPAPQAVRRGQQLAPWGTAEPGGRKG